MGKVIWVIVLIIVVIALYNVFSRFGSEVKFGNFFSLFRIPSGLNHGSSSNSMFLPVGTSPRVAVTPNQSPPPPQTQKPAKPVVIPPVGFTTDQLSPFYGQAKINSVSQGSYYNPSQLSLRADYSLQTPVNITGWGIKSNRSGGGSVFLIPKAVSDYSPLGLVPSGDILLNKNDFVNFYSNFSPVGTGLRLNKCTGYLNASIKFNPQLPNDCPSMYERSETFTFSGICQNLMTSFGGCSVPTPDQINSLPYSDTECRAILLNRPNYGSCYNRYHNDANFFSNEWRVWLQSQFNFDWAHDRLQLFDRNGLLVDQYIY
ncbi:hypothetical protein D4R51_02795 [bacterium]|nr:MAG: hypothetical protein D4R51_02795 [bacterium]